MAPRVREVLAYGGHSNSVSIVLTRAWLIPVCVTPLQALSLHTSHHRDRVGIYLVVTASLWERVWHLHWNGWAVPITRLTYPGHCCVDGVTVAIAIKPTIANIYMVSRVYMVTGVVYLSFPPLDSFLTPAPIRGERSHLIAAHQLVFRTDRASVVTLAEVINQRQTCGVVVSPHPS